MALIQLERSMKSAILLATGMKILPEQGN